MNVISYPFLGANDSLTGCNMNSNHKISIIQT